MNKILQVTNGEDIFDIECVEQIHTLVSSEILRKFRDHEEVSASDVVLDVLLMLCGVEKRDRSNWTLLNDGQVST
jgi:hypothetical protein